MDVKNQVKQKSSRSRSTRSLLWQAGGVNKRMYMYTLFYLVNSGLHRAVNLSVHILSSKGCPVSAQPVEWSISSNHCTGRADTTRRSLIKVQDPCLNLTQTLLTSPTGGKKLFLFHCCFSFLLFSKFFLTYRPTNLKLHVRTHLCSLSFPILLSYMSINAKNSHLK